MVIRYGIIRCDIYFAFEDATYSCSTRAQIYSTSIPNDIQSSISTIQK